MSDMNDKQYNNVPPEVREAAMAQIKPFFDDLLETIKRVRRGELPEEINPAEGLNKNE